MGTAGVVMADEATVKPSELSFFADDKGHVLGYRRGPDSWIGDIYFGSSKTLHRLEVTAGGTTRTGVQELSFLDPRFGEENGWRYQHVRVMAGTVDVVCGRDTVSLLPVSAKERVRLEAKVALLPSRQRSAKLLARNDDGVYFYVDEGHKKLDRALYRGRRGSLKQLKLRDTIEDDSGFLYVSSVGSLKLVYAPDKRVEVFWIERGKSTRLDLVSLSWSGTNNFIFTDLGVYLGRPFGTPCDWL